MQELHWVLNKYMVLVWLDMSELAIIDRVLMYYTMHSKRALYKLKI